MEPIHALVATTTLLLLFPLAASRPPLMEQCLLWYGHGCAAITDQDLCLSTRDGRPWRSWNKQLISGEPCVWCGGKACRNDSSKTCLPYDWVKDEIRNEKIRNNGTNSKYIVASCQDGGPPLNVLETPAVSRNVTFDRMHTLGQPHVGQACRANHILDDGRNAEYYWIFTAVSLEQCQAFCASKHYCRGVEYKKEDKYCELWWHPIQWTQAKPGYQCYRVSTRKDHGSNLDCLSYTARGLPGACSWITDEKVCLNSRDGRDRITELGSNLKIHDEPCVWCGGKQCTTATVSKCEPYDWLMRGETRGLFKFLAEDNYTVATCNKPQSSPKTVSVTSTTLQPTQNISNGTLVTSIINDSDDGGSFAWGYVCGFLLLIALCGGLALLLWTLQGKKGPQSRTSGSESGTESGGEDDPLLPQTSSRQVQLDPVKPDPETNHHTHLVQPFVPMPLLPALPQQVWSPLAVQPVQTVAMQTTVQLQQKPTMNQFDMIDTNRDGVIDRKEFNQAQAFDMIDRNRDGVIDRQEFSQAHARGQVAFAPPGI